MTAPDSKLVARVTDAIRTVPLSISSTRRGGENGLRNAEEVARAAIAACHADELAVALKRCLLVLGGESLSKSSLETALLSGVTVLAKLEGRP